MLTEVAISAAWAAVASQAIRSLAVCGVRDPNPLDANEASSAAVRPHRGMMGTNLVAITTASIPAFRNGDDVV